MKLMFRILLVFLLMISVGCVRRLPPTQTKIPQKQTTVKSEQTKDLDNVVVTGKHITKNVHPHYYDQYGAEPAMAYPDEEDEPTLPTASGSSILSTFLPGVGQNLTAALSELNSPFDKTISKNTSYAIRSNTQLFGGPSTVFSNPKDFIAVDHEVQTQEKLLTPLASARLTDSEIHEGHESLLTIAVSTHKSFVELDNDIAEYQKFAVKNKTQTLNQNVHSTIDPTKWSSYEYVKAKIWHCPEFLVCASDDQIKSTSDSTLIWTFLITAKMTNKTQDGIIGIKIYGDHDPNGLFINEISEFPPLNPSIKVVRNINWWEENLTQSNVILKLIKENVITLGLIFTAISSWVFFKKRKKTRNRRKTD